MLKVMCVNTSIPFSIMTYSHPIVILKFGQIGSANESSGEWGEWRIENIVRNEDNVVLSVSLISEARVTHRPSTRAYNHS